MNDSAIKEGGMTAEKAASIKRREKVRADGKTVRANTVKLIVLAVLVIACIVLYLLWGLNFDKMKFTGTFFAENEEALREELAKQRLYLVEAKAISDAPPSAFLTASGGISIKELTIFCRQFAIMINAGVSVIDCLIHLFAEGTADGVCQQRPCDHREEHEEHYPYALKLAAVLLGIQALHPYRHCLHENKVAYTDKDYADKARPVSGKVQGVFRVE